MRNVLITGVSTGIGKTTALKMLGNGWRVFGSVRTHGDAAEIKNQYPEKFTELLFDVTDSVSVKKSFSIVNEAISENEILDVLINNAGIALGGPLILSEDDELRKQFEVNIIGLMSVTRTFFPLLKAREKRGKVGRIINISSVSGLRALPFSGPYAASKHALEGMSDSLRMELLLYGIDVILVEPGPVKSAIWEKIPDPDNNKYIGSDYEPALRKYYKIISEKRETAIPTGKLAGLLLKISQAEKPRSRYLITDNWFKNYLLHKLIPTRLMDRLVGKYLGI